MLGIIGSAGSNFFYYYAIKETNVATAILQYLSPLFVLAYAAISREEELGPTKLIACAVSLVGCFLAVAGKEPSVIHLSDVGLLAGLAAAFCWGFSNIWMRRLVKEYNSWTALVYAFVFGTLFWLVINPPSRVFAAGYTMKEWGLFLGFAVISVLIPHSLYITGIRYLTASRAIITATFEPVVAIVTAYIFLNEVLTPVQILGAILVVSVIVILHRKPDALQEVFEGVSRDSFVER